MNWTELYYVIIAPTAVAALYIVGGLWLSRRP